VITAVDSNVLIDFLGADPQFGPSSRRWLRRCASEGRLVACEVVWAEVGTYYRSDSDLHLAMSVLGVEYSALEAAAAYAAGEAWGAYRSRGGPRVRVLPDFLIGAHALHQADRLLTRDPRLHRAYVPDLVLLEPSS
jgi:predicted nucleic acid-binding protein